MIIMSEMYSISDKDKKQIIFSCNHMWLSKILPCFLAHDYEIETENACVQKCFLRLLNLNDYIANCHAFC